MHIGYPQPAAVVVIGRLHLVIDESGLRGGEPEIVVRTPPVAQVIVDASPTPSLLLKAVGQARQVAVVVVAPHQRHVVGHAQAALHNLQHLLVGDEHLGHLLYLLIVILAQQLALVVDDLLQAAELLLLGLHALHRPVVNAAHANGKKLLAAPHLLQPLCPIALHLVAIGHVVIGSALLHVPFGHVVPQQRLAVAGANDDGEGVGHLLVSPDGEEARRALVHGGPDGVGPEAQHQLEQGLIGLRAHGLARLVGLRRPLAQAPVLVVDEDATIVHRRHMLHHEVAADGQARAAVRLHVAPPHPG